MAERLRATSEEGLARLNHEKVLALYQSGAAFWAEVLRTQLQIAQSMFTIACAWAIGARPKQLPLGDHRAAARTASTAAEPPHVTAVAKARRVGSRERRRIRRP
jgi:hypothetical protein